jgi:hypothetical protein
VPHGRYVVQIRLVPDTTRVARVRVCSAAPRQRGERLGEVGVDFAMLALLNACDASAFQAYDTPDGIQTWTHLLAALGPAGLLPYGERLESHLVVVRTGNGDGRYPVFALTNGSQRVGLEVVFVDVGEP